MGATQDFNKPDKDNPIDSDLDQIRDNWYALLKTAGFAALVIPEWTTEVITSDSPQDFSQPSSIKLTKGTQAMWYHFTFADHAVSSVQFCYDDGVSSPGLVCSSPINFMYDSDGNLTEVFDLTDGLMAWWELEEGSTDNRVDVHNAHELVYVSGTTSGTAGKVGTCYDVSSGGAHDISSANFPEVKLNTDMSFSMWLFKTSWAGSDGVFSVYSSSGQRLWTANTDKISWVVNSTTVEAVMPTNQWFHVGLYHDKTAQEIGLILNGGTPVTAAHTTGIASNSTSMKVGMFQNSAFYWNGKIDEFAVYDRVLSTAEFNKLATGIGYPG